jgi:transposase InsO family protein
VKVRDIKRPMIRAVFEAITDRGSPVMANRALALISKMLNFALSRDWIEANPAALIPQRCRAARVVGRPRRDVTRRSVRSQCRVAERDAERRLRCARRFAGWTRPPRGLEEAASGASPGCDRRIDLAG